MSFFQLVSSDEDEEGTRRILINSLSAVKVNRVEKEMEGVGGNALMKIFISRALDEWAPTESDLRFLG